MSAQLNGGNFDNGFVTSLALSYLGEKVAKSNHSLVRIAGASVIGGTAPKVTGGKFVSGAASVAFNAAIVDKDVEAYQLAVEKDKLIREFAGMIACEGDCGEAISSAMKASAQKDHDEALKGWGKANGKIINFKKNNPGETVPITEADLKAIAKYEALVLDKSMTDSYHSDAQGRADGYFFALDNKFTTFQITDGSLAGAYLGSDINYYYTGFVAAHHGVGRGYMNTLITLHNGAQAVGRWSARDWNQISTGKRFASFGYDFYGAQK